MTLTAVLLAGGESRRMGRDKATIEFQNEPLWRRQLETLRALQPLAIFVSVRETPSWLPTDVELVLDDPPSRGPLSGLAKALGVLRTSHLVALCVDMPFMTPEQLNALWQLADAGRGVVPLIADRAEPLAAVYPAEASSNFSTALSRSDFSLQPIIRKLADEGKVRLASVAAEDEHLYRNVNEPADLKEGRF